MTATPDSMPSEPLPPEPGSPDSGPSASSQPETMLAQLLVWCRAEGLPGDPSHAGDGTPEGLVVALEPDHGLDVRIDLGDGERPLRFRQRFTVWGDDEAAEFDRSGLDQQALTTLVDDGVRRRSSLIDATVDEHGTADIAVSVYPDGLNRHSFMTAIYECLKLRESIRADVRAAAVTGTAIDALDLLADRLWSRPTS